MSDGSGFPQPVEPRPNARVVDFPWQQARAAVIALEEAESLLRGQLESRVGMDGAISDWEGRFRDEFDEKHASLMMRAGGAMGADGLTARLAMKASAIVSGAEEANLMQSSYNVEADAAQAGLTIV